MLSVLSAVAEIERENSPKNAGVAGVAKGLNSHGYVKKLRQNNTITGFIRDF